MKASRNSLSFDGLSNWLTRFEVGILKLLGRLPLGLQYPAGRLLGWLGYHLFPTRRHITTTNIDLCFPEFTSRKRKRLVRQVFYSTGLGLVETAVAWFGVPDTSRVVIEGLQYLRAAAAKQQGVILIGAHFSTLDMAGAMLAREIALDVIYRRSKNPIIEQCMRQGRQRYYGGVIERSNTRSVLNRLRQGKIVWYAADQDYGPKHSVFAPFFAQQAATISATARFAKLNNSPVLFLSHFRNTQHRSWSIRIHPELQGFPSGNDLEDATRINAIIESEIRRHPDQYLWLHRRFKTRPPGELQVY